MTFQLADDALFDKFAEPAHTHADIIHNYCPECQIPMELSGSDYQCANCGLTQKNEGDSGKNYDDVVHGSIRITTGANRGRFYNVTGDYTKTQRKVILLQLKQRQVHYKGTAFPKNILTATADQYNLIQKMITEDDIDCNGVVVGQKKFVRRGNIKDEVLAAILYFECIREKGTRKKKDIAAFMGLATNGFARGEDIVRNLEAEGKINIPVDDEPIAGFVDRYLEALNLDDPDMRYSDFITEIVEESELRRIGMNSQISSKIVGAIWIVIVRGKLNITAQALEKASDNTKKNTFMKFYNAVFSNMAVFAAIFDKHAISRA